MLTQYKKLDLLQNQLMIGVACDLGGVPVKYSGFKKVILKKTFLIQESP